MLPGFISRMMKKKRPSVDFLAAGSATPSSTSWNFSLTVPKYDRTVLLVVALSMHTVANNATINSCSWNGISGSPFATAGIGIANNYNRMSLYGIIVPAGSQNVAANIAVAASGSAARATYGAWVVKDYSIATPIVAPTDTNSNGNVLELAYASLKANDVYIAAVHDYRTSNHTWMWSFGTEDYDANVSTTTVHYSGNHQKIAADGTLTLSVTTSDAANFAYGLAVGAAFR